MTYIWQESDSECLTLRMEFFFFFFLPAYALQSHTGEEMPTVWYSDLGDPSNLLVPFTLSGCLLLILQQRVHMEFFWV